jgi:8-oxo-dGTP pyrophosphatase MutT (NUDIX family)
VARRLLAGVVFVRQGKILLVHSTGSAEDKDWGIPKGHQEPGEPTLQAAVREVREETGIDIPTSMLGAPLPFFLEHKNRVLSYWVVNATWLPIPDVLPVEQLQIEEVDEARFVPTMDAEMIIEPWQMPLLNHIRGV